MKENHLPSYEKTLVGNKDGQPRSLGVSTSNLTCVKRDNEVDLNWEELPENTPEGFLEYDDAEAGYQLDLLIEALKIIKGELETNEVKILMSKEKPITFLAKDSDSRLAVSLAHIEPGSGKRKRLNPIENNLFGYHVICEEDGCTWNGDRYLSKEAALEASEDHLYFTGHDCKVNSPRGKEVKQSR